MSFKAIIPIFLCVSVVSSAFAAPRDLTQEELTTRLSTISNWTTQVTVKNRPKKMSPETFSETRRPETKGTMLQEASSMPISPDITSMVPFEDLFKIGRLTTSKVSSKSTKKSIFENLSKTGNLPTTKASGKSTKKSISNTMTLESRATITSPASSSFATILPMAKKTALLQSTSMKNSPEVLTPSMASSIMPPDKKIPTIPFETLLSSMVLNRDSNDKVLVVEVTSSKILPTDMSSEMAKTTLQMPSSERNFMSNSDPTSSSYVSKSSSEYLYEPKTLPPNLQSLSLVLSNESSSSSSISKPSSIPNKDTTSHNPPPKLPHENDFPNHILSLNPSFSSPVPTLSPPSEAPEKEDVAKQESMAPSSTPWSPVIEKFSLTHNAASIVNITGEVGGSVFMPCATHHSMERQVSWVRRRDWHILTSGELTYTKEERFSVHHPKGSTDWILVIKFLTLDDAGTYECQVSTGTGILSRLVDLEVMVPKAVIPGNGEYHIDAGSTITLDCYVHQTLVAPEYIFWYHNSRMINYDKKRGGVQVKLETGSQVKSRLTVSGATPADSGNYTCSAANSQPAYTTVYITNGNMIAAIQPRAISGASNIRNCLTEILSVLSLCLFPHLK